MTENDIISKYGDRFQVFTKSDVNNDYFRLHDSKFDTDVIEFSLPKYSDFDYYERINLLIEDYLISIRESRIDDILDI